MSKVKATQISTSEDGLACTSDPARIPNSAEASETLERLVDLSNHADTLFCANATCATAASSCASATSDREHLTEEVEMTFDGDSRSAAVLVTPCANPYAVDARANDAEVSVSEDSDTKEALYESNCLPPTEEHGNLALYSGDEDQELPHSKKKGLSGKEKKDKSYSVLGSGIESIKYLYSIILLIFSVVVVMGAIFCKQTVATGDYNIHPAIAFFIFWFLICWLAMMEGGQGALVGLQPIDKALYAESHSRTLRNTTLAHKGDNMERFIVGRQFLVVLVVFVTNLMASAVKDADVLGLSTGLIEVFLRSGLAVILITIMLGQLTAQISAANCMLDFLNNYFVLFTIYVSLAIEMSGLLHCVYLVQIAFQKITNKPSDADKPQCNAIQKVLFWGRVLISTAILGFAFAVTLSALFKGQTAMWEGVPKSVSVIVLFILMCFVGMMEGMQIALFAVVNLPEEKLKQHTIAYKNCQLTFSGQNLQAFLIGRQVCVTVFTFVVARITTVNVDIDAGEETIFGVSSGLQNFFNTGLLGAVITTVVASLVWRIIALSLPLAFLSNPIIYVIIRICLVVEKSGICSAAWFLAVVHKALVRFQLDEVYVRTAEERAAASKKADLELDEEAKSA